MSNLETFRRSLNFRDLGNYKTKDNKRTKSGLIYRCSSLKFMNEEELEAFKKMNFKTIIDLRSELEVTTYPDPQIPGAHTLEKSALVSEEGKSIDFSPKGMLKMGKEAEEQLEKLKYYYGRIIFQNHAFDVIFDELLEGNTPLMFHCATGKDRTGLAAIVVLLALNVEIEDVKYDYLLSNEYRKEILEEHLKDIDKDKEPELYELTTMLYGVSENNFDVAMQSVYEKYETREEYLEKEFNLDKDKLQRLRDLYTEKEL